MFNESGGYWSYIENEVRKKAQDFENGLKICVGTIGVMTLKNKMVDVEWYLDLKSDPKRIPVPRILYKRVENCDVVYLLFNNPHEKDENIIAEFDQMFGEGKYARIDTNLDSKTGLPKKGFAVTMTLKVFDNNFGKLFPNNNPLGAKTNYIVLYTEHPSKKDKYILEYIPPV